MDVRLLLIDPQVDFCDPNGALFVKGAVEDCERTAHMISRVGKNFNKIYSTFDSHSQYQIFHPMLWMTKDQGPVAPFTQITYDAVNSGMIIPVDPNLLDWCKMYTKSLEEGGRYPLIIWPYHCLIGTPGWCMDPSIMKAVHQWERDTYRIFKPITKGSCFKTEHYSAVKAEVEVPEDPTTQLNYKGLISPLEEADMVILMGQARSHCLANTVRDIMANFSNPEYIKKLYIAEDGTSDVTGFEHLGDAFFDDFIKAGGNITTTDKILA
jgi:nicotinamidase/pyrazinamidase